MAEITDRKSFEKWLEGKPTKWAQVLVMRSALRVLPLVDPRFDSSSLKSYTQRNIILACFRSLSMSWTVLRYPVQGRGRSAAYFAALASSRVDAASTAGIVYASAAIGVRDASAFAARAVTTSTFEVDDSTAMSDPTFAADAAVRIATDDSVHTIADYWKYINRDAEVLEGRNSVTMITARALIEHVLWSNDEGENATPDWIYSEYNNLVQNLSELDHNWHVWTEWYQSRLDGKESWALNSQNAKSLLLRIADQESNWWAQGPSVNAEIAGWLADFRAEEASDEILPDKLPDRPTQELVENSAATSFIVRDGKFEVSPTNVWADDLHRAENLRNLAAVLAQKMHQQFLNTNAEPGLAKNISDGLSILQQPISSIQPDQLRLFGQSVSAKARTYGHPNAEWELSAEIVQNLFELSTLLEDLQGFVKSDLKENAEAIRALDINPENLDKAKALGDDVLAAVQAHGSFFTDSAIGVFEIASNFSENAPTEHVQVMVEGERILLTENLAVAMARELAKPDVQNAVISSSQKDDPYWIDFKNRFVDRLSEDLPETIADGLKKDVHKSIGYLGGSIAAIIYALSSLGVIAAASSIIIAAAWITYELRRRIRELDAQDGKGNKDDEP